MKKRLNVLVIVGMCFMLAGCCISHDWQEANCTTPKTCSKCEEIEGEALGHTWVEATCSEPKHCTVCGVTEGEALEHDLTDANYQQAATCKVCGIEVGEPLQAEQYGMEMRAELDVVYDFETPCYGDYAENYSTVAKVMFTNYNVFESDDTHPAQEGYEWKTVDMISVVGDENGRKYGYYYEWKFNDYYWFDNYDANEGTFSVNYHGIEYPDCRFMFESTGGGWSDVEQYGWERTNTKRYTISVLLPIGADGFYAGIYDWMSDCWDVEFDENYWAQIPSEEYLYFRFE